ncbi:methionine adenosyltransferase [Rhodosalinus sp. K401]|uniref:methionine adenosyltransferase n=1 Tax=Rhodosalinus sp. K401 TaxID=3239195 RepID=UPI003523F0BB
MSQTSLFTSESVSRGHPDKLCDLISDTILDACLAQDPDARVAVEAAIKSQRLFLFGELTTTADVDPAELALQAIRVAGYDDPAWGLDTDRLAITIEIDRQSREIAAGVGEDGAGAGDQGLMFGFATDETTTGMPLALSLAHDLMERHDALRRSGSTWHLGPDAKAQVTIARRDGRPVGVTDVVLSSQHSPDLPLRQLRDILREEIVYPVLRDLRSDTERLQLNPAGTFHLGGPAADAGLTGRKIIVDTYGGAARHGGGAFSGKDPTKVDRSAAYAARQIARDVINRGWARRCEVQLAYAIGEERPVSVAFETEGGPAPTLIARFREAGVDLHALCIPRAIIDRLELRRPIYARTAAFGHFGREGFPWEAALA